ncbi:hypothetical protein LCGC14_3014430 [marine sediment metagenome]|uniref:Uncharacterized protein n=1 Tax=marine sediment metagenome TaxID=412755 RepID=A0A0F8ZNB7_9ZZZZ|nr:hypothetical protein [Bacteroides sp.]
MGPLHEEWQACLHLQLLWFRALYRRVVEGRIDKTQPAVFSADETADVGLDDATQVADLVFKNVHDSEFTGYINKVTISIPE